MDYLIKMSYDGSKFYGFQRLNENISVQAVLEDALTTINKSQVLVKGAGRTDRGVHALCQCASFHLDIDITVEGLKKALNSLVKPYIYITDVKEVSSDFHARFSVKKKTYCYKINLGDFSPLYADYVYQSEYKLDIELMKEVANKYLGVHDFHNFVSGDRKYSVCIVYDVRFEIEDNILNIYFEGKSFYRYMVRNLVGAMIEVARGKEDIKLVDRMLSREECSSYTAPACGLYLYNIEY